MTLQDIFKTLERGHGSKNLNHKICEVNSENIIKYTSKNKNELINKEEQIQGSTERTLHFQKIRRRSFSFTLKQWFFNLFIVTDSVSCLLPHHCPTPQGLHLFLNKKVVLE